MIQISFIGVSPWAFAVYQLAFQSEVLFHHSNLRLPIHFERLLNKVLVTPRMRPFLVQGQRVHEVGLPYHWGRRGVAVGDSANDLLAMNEEPNVRIMETKALTCFIRPGRRPRGEAALDELNARMRETA